MMNSHLRSSQTLLACDGWRYPKQTRKYIFMAVTIEGFTIVVKKERIEPLLSAQLIVPPNNTPLADDNIWRCSFMAKEDADKFISILGKFGLSIGKGSDSDAVLINEFDLSMAPHCEWLLTDKWEKAVIAWKAGTTPETVVAREGWDPKIGSGLIFHDRKTMKNLQFVRLDGNIEVFFDMDTGQEVYIGRTSTPVDSMFTVATKVISKHFINPGQSPITGEAAREVDEAVAMLDKVIEKVPKWWNAHWFHGKGLLAIGKYEQAYNSFNRAYALENAVEAIPRELAGVCLELQKYNEAVSVSEKSAALAPNKADVLGNLSLAYLMAGRLDAATKTISSALQIDQTDAINQALSRMISDVCSGKREQPMTLKDLTKPSTTKRKPFWKLW